MKKRNYLFLGCLILLPGLPINGAEETSKLTERREESLGDLAQLPDDILLELAIASTLGAKTHKEALNNAENFLNASQYLNKVIKPKFYQTNSIQELRALATFEKNQLLVKKYEDDFDNYVGYKSLAFKLNVAKAALKQSDGKIIIVGYKGWASTAKDIAMVRLNSNGSLDSSFGSNGIVLTDIPNTTQDFAESVALQSDGKILVGGSAGGTTKFNFVLARYNSNGTLDKTFNTSGKIPGIVITSPEVFNIEAYYAIFSALAIQSNGKIVAAGYYINEDEPSRMIIARYNADGTIDTIFGDNGRALGDEGFVSYVFVKSNGDIVVGFEDTEKNMKFTVFNSSGKLIK